MTVAAAVNLECLIRRDHRFVLLMSDSRFTYSDGSNADHGAKLWKLAPQVGAAFAGDVGIAENMLSAAQELLGDTHPISFDSIQASLEVSVGRFFDKQRPIALVVGAVSPHGESRVFKVEPDSGPVVHEVTSKVALIGYPDAKSAFSLKHCPRGPVHQIQQNRLAEFHMHAFPYVMMFKGAIAEGGETVGFPMQVMLVTEFGEQTLMLSAIDSSDAFQNLSAGPGEVFSGFRDHERTKVRHRMRIGVCEQA
jgi:hypothetical protein